MSMNITKIHGCICHRDVKHGIVRAPSCVVICFRGLSVEGLSVEEGPQRGATRTDPYHGVGFGAGPRAPEKFWTLDALCWILEHFLGFLSTFS